MHTAGLKRGLLFPLPEAIDQHFPPSSPFQFGDQGQGFRDGYGDQINTMFFPEATSAWCLSNVLQQLSNPTMSGLTDPKTLSTMIWAHIRAMSSMGWRVGTSYM